MAIHIKDIQEAITIIKETQVINRRLIEIQVKIDKFLKGIETDIHTDWDTIENQNK